MKRLMVVFLVLFVVFVGGCVGIFLNGVEKVL